MIKAPQSGQTAIAATLIDSMGSDLAAVLETHKIKGESHD